MKVKLEIELRQLERDEEITHNCFHSLDGGRTLAFLANPEVLVRKLEMMFSPRIEPFGNRLIG